jgi:hypothetical protein
MLDGQETELEIIDHPSAEISVSRRNVLAWGEENKEEGGKRKTGNYRGVSEDRSRDKLHRMNRSGRTREIVLTSFNKP